MTPWTLRMPTTPDPAASASAARPATQVWVVDDDRSGRFVLATALREAGYDVTAFEDAATVRAALETRAAPDLLFTDVRMPGEDGLALLDAIKARHPQLPVCLLYTSRCV